LLSYIKSTESGLHKWKVNKVHRWGHCCLIYNTVKPG
jgi:hypothetical protein